MRDMDILIEQMVAEIWGRTLQLEDPRLEMFLEWLTTHSLELKRTFGGFRDLDRVALRRLVIEGQFRSTLRGWLQGTPVQGLLWEYEAVTAEINWWRDLDPARLKMMQRTNVQK